MIKTKVSKQSLVDWAVENVERIKIDRRVVEARSVLVWIEKTKDGFFFIRTTPKLIAGDFFDHSCGYARSFKEAKQIALNWIDHFTKD
jgi:hypothetical protein